MFYRGIVQSSVLQWCSTVYSVLQWYSGSLQCSTVDHYNAVQGIQVLQYSTVDRYSYNTVVHYSAVQWIATVQYSDHYSAVQGIQVLQLQYSGSLQLHYS